MTEQEEDELPTAARKAGSDIEENPHLDERLRNGDELVRRQDVQQFLKKRMKAYTDENGELRDDLTKVEYGRYRELKKQLQEVQNQ